MGQQPRIINVAGDYIASQTIGTYIAHAEHVHTDQPSSEWPSCSGSKPAEDVAFEEVHASDTSFFTSRFPHETIVKNLREAIDFASSKADACRRIMALETQGYIILSNVGDDRKAELINPYAQPKFTLTGEDFKKARNRS